MEKFFVNRDVGTYSPILIILSNHKASSDTIRGIINRMKLTNKYVNILQTSLKIKEDGDSEYQLTIDYEFFGETRRR